MIAAQGTTVSACGRAEVQLGWVCMIARRAIHEVEGRVVDD